MSDTYIIEVGSQPAGIIVRAPGGYRWYQGGCYVETPGGWQAVSPRYCGVQAQYAPPPPRYYDDTPRCMRSPSYNPRRGTFIGRDGYERPCP